MIQLAKRYLGHRVCLNCQSSSEPDRGKYLEESSNLHQSGIVRSELSLWIGVVTAGLFIVFGDVWLADLSNPFWSSVLFCWLFAVMLWMAFSVVRHADSLAVILGEPYGTLI